jgi:ElaB/YqjD/DUF883 family membrane-anchored ribosome-binding protein
MRNKGRLMSTKHGHNESKQHGSTLEGRRTASSRSTQTSTSERGENVSEYLSQSASHVQDFVRERAGTATLVALGAGLGVGLLIGIALRSSQSRPRSWRERLAAEGIGRRLLEHAESVFPEVLSKRLGL